MADVAAWLKKRIILPSHGYSTYDQYEKMQEKHDLVVSFRGQKNKYYEMFRYVASTYHDLHFAHTFSAPVSCSSLTAAC